MSITAVLLFGSLAREDHVRGSDTDILLVGDDGEPRHLSAGHLSMFYYPWAKLADDARRGDLFLCHIVREAKVLFDPEFRLQQLRSAFELKANYQFEIKQATDLGWFLLRHGSNINSTLLVKRMIWCVRTILIARSAEGGEPVFAPLTLAQRSKSDAAKELLMERHSRRPDAAMRHRFHSFLLSDTEPDGFYESATQEDFLERFTDSLNKVALQTSRQTESSNSAYV